MVTAASADVVVSWEEPPLGQTMAHELVTFYKRARPRRWWLLVAALVIGGAMGAYRLAFRPSVEAWVVLKVEENRGQEGERARSNGELRHYLMEAVFSRQALTEALKADPEWGTRAASLGPEDIDELREEIGLEIEGNTFIEERRAGDPPRSVRLRISWESAKADTAEHFVDLLVGLVSKTELERLRQSGVRTQGAAEMAMSAAQAYVDRLLAELRALDDVPNVPAVQRHSLMRQLNSANERLVQARAALVRTSLAQRADAETPWHFTVLDRRPPSEPPSAVSDALFSAIATTVGSYPVLLLLMGAFSWRLTRTRDAEELGFAVLGTIPGHSVLVAASQDAADSESNS